MRTTQVFVPMIVTPLLPHFGGGGAFFVADHIHVDDGIVEVAVSEPLHDKAGIAGLFR